MTSHLVRDGDATARGAVAGAAALFGSAAIATELLEPSLSAPAIAAWRIIIGGVALVVVSCCAGAAPWQYPRHLRITIAGALCVIAFQVGFFVAVGRLGAAVATMITIGMCPLAAGLAHRLRHRSVLGRRWWAGVSLAWGGIALMTTQGAGDVVGVFCAIFSGCCFPLYGAAIRRLIDDRPPLSAVATVFGAAVLPAGFAAAVAGGHPFGDASTLAAVTYAGSISTAVAYVLWARGLRVLSLRDTFVISVLEPVVTAVLAVAILGQELTARSGVGVVLTVVGIALASGTGRGTRPSGDGIVNPCARPLIRQGDWSSPSPCVTNSDLGPAR